MYRFYYTDTAYELTKKYNAMMICIKTYVTLQHIGDVYHHPRLSCTPCSSALSSLSCSANNSAVSLSAVSLSRTINTRNSMFSRLKAQKVAGLRCLTVSNLEITAKQYNHFIIANNIEIADTFPYLMMFIKSQYLIQLKIGGYLTSSRGVDDTERSLQ